MGNGMEGEEKKMKEVANERREADKEVGLGTCLHAKEVENVL